LINIKILKQKWVKDRRPIILILMTMPMTMTTKGANS
jgi:hypothetical protein